MSKIPRQEYVFENGDRMPAVGLGTWKSEAVQLDGAIKAAVDIGYRHIDCAFIYDNESIIGRALGDLFQAGTVRREELWITSKLWNDAHAPADVLPAVERALTDLKLDYLDLYLIHWPVALKRGIYVPKTADELISLEELPLTETWDAMGKLVDKGLCRHIGVSNFNTSNLSALIDGGYRNPEVNQVEMHPYNPQPTLCSFCRKKGIHLTAYSPLGSSDRPVGLKAPNEPSLLKDPLICEVAEEQGATPAQVLISWALHRNTSVIPKSVHPERLAENLKAVEIHLEEDEIKRIDSIGRRYRYLAGKFWEFEGGTYSVTDLWDE